MNQTLTKNRSQQNLTNRPSTDQKQIRTTYVDLSNKPALQSQPFDIEAMLTKLIAGDEKLRELLVKTTHTYIKEHMNVLENNIVPMESARSGKQLTNSQTS